MLNTEYPNVTQLGAPCDRCGALLQLVEGFDNTVECPHCPAVPGRSDSTVADALEDWYAHNPPPAIAAVTSALDVVPRHPWVIECDGYPFNSLTEAEAYAANHGHRPIFCRLASSQKAANDHR